MAAGRVLWLGFGSLGISAAPLLQARGFELVGVRRDIAKLPAGISGRSADVLDPGALQQLAEQNWSGVIVTLTAAAYNANAYQRTYVEGAKNIARAFAGEVPVLFASSTSVYENADGTWVDENTVLQPSGFSGRAMLEAEEALQSGRVNSCAVRFSGIYGRAEPRMLKQLREGSICSKSPVSYTNRIHYRDAGAVLVHLLERRLAGVELAACYLATDSYPAPRREVMEWLAQAEGIDLQGLTEAAASSRGYNKRCSNARLLATDFRLEYPDYRSGMAQWVSH